ncbi:MAG: iron-siderophore ABC transporter substrate-binding protein [Candidatus Microbacterium phytovorans]|uniref:Iron-siderophore ABC transporter substrate-binding protein n=1 Tax=Candidatus Microbacterium phytovorans TaxID=3121374 RepID=A0AAJ5W3C5_9MICO|nr:iron-siderophore ABC transporter substrate-binding protein [Microbacterium sp.]WEK14234.1 MAG: iron-siderophore ABC transporter substrate-binding protein [Microbacterium sp.]
MPRFRTASVAAIAAALLLTGCATTTTPTGSGSPESSASADAFPLTITHAFGETTITEKPERVATVSWANQEAALALGVVPVGMPAVTWGDDDGDGVLPWVETKLEELGAETPVLFDETEGIDFEAVADTQPDVILAAYSGITQEDYDTLSKIAPVVAYPDVAWGTTWQELTVINGTALGLRDEAEALVDDLTAHIAELVSAYPAVAGKTTLFSSFDATDLSQLGFYSLEDPRPLFLNDLGLVPAATVTEQSAESSEFWITNSTEEIERFEDLDVLVTYGDDATLAAMQADPLLSRIPAVANGAVVVLPIANAPLSAAANPSPLSLTDDLTAEYVSLIGEAAEKVSE